MAKSDIIGREREMAILSEVCKASEAKLVAVYGRRRVGKTYLIRQFFNDRFDFAFTGSFQASKQVQLSLFNTALNGYSGQEFSKPKDWCEAFEQLRVYLSSRNQRQLIVFLDELPWMDTPKSQFLTAFSFFWNSWASMRAGLKIIICGSSTSWMLDKIIGDRGGLYGRASRSIYLLPFNLHEVELFLQRHKGIEWNRYQILEAYMILGGIPYYLDMLDSEKTFSQNIDALFFAGGGSLRLEYDFLFRSLFKSSTLYRQVVEIISKKGCGMTIAEIKQALDAKAGGSLAEVIKNLERCDFIRRYCAFGKKERDAMYQLIDPFTLFHLRFIKGNDGQDEHFWSNMSQAAHASWAGYAFENVCLHHINQIRQRLGITGVLTATAAWSIKQSVDVDGTIWRGAQIDLVLNRGDHVVDLCEMKYSGSTFVVTAEYEKILRERKAAFAHFTHTRSALHNILITTYGLNKNKYSSVFNAIVTADDLFATPQEI